MYLQRLLQINVATLAALAALVLGMGQDNTLKPLVVWLAAATSIWLTDVKGWICLSRTAVSLIALPLVAYFAVQMPHTGGDARLLLVIDIILYLQVILFFQKKEIATYWQLIIISLLEVVVAAGFSHGVAFGILLVIYVMVAMSALALLLLHTQWSLHQSGQIEPIVQPRGAGPLPTAAAFRGSCVGSSRSSVVGELFHRLATLGIGTLVLATLIFFTVPRLGRTAWRGPMLSPKTVVGFSEKVTLGQLGEILESHEEVMRVQLTDPKSNRPYPPQPQLYLRGAVLTSYDRGQWSPPEPTSADLSSSADLRSTPFVPVVSQHIRLEPLAKDVLFSVWPPVLIGKNGSGSIIFDKERGWLRRPGLSGQPLFYTLDTTGFFDGHTAPLVPCNDPGVGAAANDRPADLDLLLQCPDNVPHLAELAKKWLAKGPPNADRVGRARLLEAKLSESDRFQYSLQGQPRDINLDPIEDFVVNNPRGHCEYFATALALMLRSQGIPARVVLGYKCDEWNDLGKLYKVRQSDAHAWVEAYLGPDDIPRRLRWGNDDPRRWAGGAWLRLDPTPPARDRPPAGSMLGKLQDQLNWIDSLWSDYVMDLDRKRQYEAIYQPLLHAMQTAARNLCSRQWWGNLLQAAGRALHVSQWNGLGGWMLHVGLPLLIGLVLAGWVARDVWSLARWLWRRGAGSSGKRTRRSRSQVAFYRSFEALLARRGLVRAPAQTPREFVRTVADLLESEIGDGHLSPELSFDSARRHVPVPSPVSLERIVEAYYRVRFGGLPLDNPAREAVEHGLAELEQWRKASRRRWPPAGKAKFP